MKNWPRRAGWSCCFALLPATTFAAEDVFRQTWQKGPVFFVVTVVLALFFWAVFIHLAAAVTKLEHRSFGRALRAAVISWILGLLLPVVLGLAFGLFKVESQPVILAATCACLVLPGTLAIRNSYEAGFVTSLFTYLMALVVMFVLMIAATFALGLAGVPGPS